MAAPMAITQPGNKVTSDLAHKDSGHGDGADGDGTYGMEHMGMVQCLLRCLSTQTPTATRTPACSQAVAVKATSVWGQGSSS